MISFFLNIVLFILFPALVLLSPGSAAQAGSLDSPDIPGATESYTLQDIHQRLESGANGSRSTFTEPATGPSTPTMHSINDIMAMAPAVDETNGATDGNVAEGKTYWGLTSGQWGLRTGTCCAGLPISAAQYVFVELAEENSDTDNAQALLNAYAKAETLTPKADNRVVVIVPPGRYDLGTGALEMDTAYIDLVGLTTNAEAQYIYGQSNGNNTGVLMQTSDNVRIENLVIECTRSSGSLNENEFDPAAYFPSTDLPNTIIKNCEFKSDDSHAWSMRISIEYSGIYEDCAAGKYAFGGYYGTASGTFNQCIAGGWDSFGGAGGTASGTFIGCTGRDYSFGGWDGTASGNFIRCTGGDHSFGGAGGTASGTFTGCAGGDWAFGGWDGTASGTFTGCTGGDHSFGGWDGTASGTFSKCTGENYSFGGDNGIASGTFIGCTGGNYSFGGGLLHGTAAGGKFYYCNGDGPNAWAIDATTTLYCIKNGAAYP